MDIKQYKASLQLAQMRHNAEQSESSKALLDKAQQAYDSAQNSEVEKNDPVSGKPENPGSDADQAKPAPVRKSPAAIKAAVKAITTDKPVVKPLVEPAGDTLPATTSGTGDETGDNAGDQDHTDESGEPADQSTTEEKKTEE